MTGKDALKACDLLPCPFCGGGASFQRDGDPRYPVKIIDSHIEPCPLGFHTLQISYPDEATAAAAWNTRSSGWQPISTAPKDGREVVMGYGLGLAPLVVRWDAAEDEWLAVGFEQHIATPPTRWMPLPSSSSGEG